MGKRVHPFLVRMPIELFAEAEVISFRHRISLNLLLNEMIKYAHQSQGFKQILDIDFKVDHSRGHFVFIKDVR